MTVSHAVTGAIIGHPSTMTDLVTNTIEIRGKPYIVSEMTGKTMQTVRALIDKDKWRAECFVTFKCLVDPKVPSEDAASDLPHHVIDMVSKEAFRLTALDSTKND